MIFYNSRKLFRRVFDYFLCVVLSKSQYLLSVFLVTQVLLNLLVGVALLLRVPIGFTTESGDIRKGVVSMLYSAILLD